MKSFATIFIAALVAAAFAGCSRERAVGRLEERSAIRFSATINETELRSGGSNGTRVVDSEWETGDFIGVFMRRSADENEGSGAGEGENSETVGGSETDGTSGGYLSDNVKHVYGSDGSFRVADSADAIFYPEDGAAVDFVAYYPFSESIEDGEDAIDLTDQSDPAIDLLYSDNERNRREGLPFLHFDHVLSRLRFDVRARDSETDLDGLRVRISGVGTRGRFDFSTGEVSVDAIGEVDALMEDTTDGVSAGAIVLPGMSELRVHFIFGDGEESVLVLDGEEYASGVSYGYEVVVDESADTVVVGNSEIGDWDEQTGGGYDVGKGSREAFYLETFGEGNYLRSYDWCAPAAFSDWASGFEQVVYSDPGGEIVVRSTEPDVDDPHLFFPEGVATLTVSGLPTDGWANVVFSFEVNDLGSGESFEVSVDGEGTEFATREEDGIYTVEFGLPEGADSVEIDSWAEFGMEVDNVSLTGLRADSGEGA